MMKKSLRSELKASHFAYMTVPVLLTSGLMILNLVHFDDVFDFGLRLQNPVFADYLRIQNGLFSPLTQFYGMTYKLFSYYASPEIIRLMGLEGKTASFSECVPPYLLNNNLLMLLLLPLVVYGIYRALRAGGNMRRLVITVGLTALVINGLIISAGNIVTMRYFVECYYLFMLLVLAGVAAVLLQEFLFR